MIDFSRLPRHTFAGDLMRRVLGLIPHGTVVPVLQGTLRGQKWVVGSSVHGCWLGSYERDKQAALSTALRSGDVVYDVGANVGFYTLFAARRVGGGGRVYAFEPLPRNLTFLRRHIALNGHSNVDVMPLALSDEDGFATFDEGANECQGRLATHGGLRVATASLDRLISARNLRPPTLIKMDIEGGEVLALEGARETLARHKPTLFIATHGADVHERVVTFLGGLGYRLADLQGDPDINGDELVARAP
jgi:FkbM family methyltransferase